jgi:flagellar motor switch protein FliG
MDPKKLPGSLKVAILLQSMGRNEAERVLNSLNDSERELIMGHLSQMGAISPELVERVAEEFSTLAASRRSISEGVQATHRAGKREPEALSSSSGSASLTTLRSLETEQLVDLIKDEHPQTIAVILVHLESNAASEALSKLPDEKKTDIALRIANLNRVVSGMVEEIDKAFEDVLKGKEAPVIHKTGGVGRLAEILNQIDMESGDMILSEIEESNQELAGEIKQLMFVFDDLVLVDDKGIQKVLRRVETKELAVALKAASEEVRDKIFRNMSERASEMLREEIEATGAIRMKEVEDAQSGITRIIQEMEQKGEIVIRGRRGEEYVG